MTNLTDIFSTSPRCKRTNPLEAIPAALEMGVIYNVDFKDLKEAVNQALEAAWGAAVKNLYLSHEDRRERYDWVATDNLYYGQGPQIHNLKSVIKKIAKVEKIDPKCDLIAPARAICEMVTPVIEDMNTLKGMVVKGRKPSTDPRLTPERTLDNTGTCAACGENVKRDKKGKIVSHGYRVLWNSHQGNCFGVGYDPIEVSPEGLIAYKEAAIRGRDGLIKTIAYLEAADFDTVTVDKKTGYGYNARTEQVTYEKGSVRFGEVVGNRLRKAQSGLKQTETVIESCTTAIANWEAKPLPDAKK
jgi:hypothetical protein